MSRIGRAPITVPAGVTVTVGEDNLITVKGAQGTLTYKAPATMTVKVEGAVVTVTRPDDENESRSLHGLTRTLINNMVVGVSTGYSKKLEIVGVGYRAAKEGKNLVLNIGYSHQITMPDTDLVTTEVPNPNKIIVMGADKQAVGQFAAEVRGHRPPEPYKGKGIKYADEVIRRKEGKTGAK